MTLLWVLGISVFIFMILYTHPRIEAGVWWFPPNRNNIFRIEYDGKAACKCKFLTIGIFYITWLSKGCSKEKLEEENNL